MNREFPILCARGIMGGYVPLALGWPFVHSSIAIEVKMPRAPKWFPAWRHLWVRSAIYTATLATFWLGPSYIAYLLFGMGAARKTSTFLGVTFFCGWLAWVIMEMLRVRPWQLRFTFLVIGFVVACGFLVSSSIKERREREIHQEVQQQMERSQKRERENATKQRAPKPIPRKEESSYAPP